jgi:hypothetical protein
MVVEGTGVARGRFAGSCGKVRAGNEVLGCILCTEGCWKKRGAKAESVTMSRQMPVMSIQSKRRRADGTVDSDDALLLDSADERLDEAGRGERGSIIAVE